jgi:outer membrane biosynthesis protein TonB
MFMKTTILGLSVALCLTLNAQAQLAQNSDLVASQGEQVAMNFITEVNTKSDVNRANVSPSAAWLQSFSSSLIGHISYPARGRAYQITGTMYAKINIDADGKMQILGFQKSLGKDFEQAISDALHQLSVSKIKSLALPLEGSLNVLLPIQFKD